MKKFEKPVIKFSYFNTESIVTVSGGKTAQTVAEETLLKNNSVVKQNIIEIVF